jgi:hypothetical protein
MVLHIPLTGGVQSGLWIKGPPGRKEEPQVLLVDGRQIPLEDPRSSFDIPFVESQHEWKQLFSSQKYLSLVESGSNGLFHLDSG